MQTLQEMSQLMQRLKRQWKDTQAHGKHYHTTKQKTEIRRDFLSSVHGKRLQRLNSLVPSGNFTDLTDPLPRRHASALIQLHTSHAPLNHHLARIGKSPSPSCPNCHQGSDEETVIKGRLDNPR